MSEPTSSAPSGETPTEADADLDRLQAERDELARRVEQLEDRPAKRHRLRRVFTAILLVLAVLLFALAVPGVWVRRTIGDTDRYVATVAPLAREPAVQDYLARTVTTQVFTALDVESRLSSALTERAPRLVFLTGPITDAVRGFVEEKVRELFGTEAFAEYWERANRFVHEQVIAALRGEGETLTLVEGQVVLNLLPLVNQGLQAVSGVATELIGRPIDLPELTGEEVPVEAIARIESALGVDLPDRFGTVTVYDSEELAAVQDAIDMAGRLIVLTVVALDQEAPHAPAAHDGARGGARDRAPVRDHRRRPGGGRGETRERGRRASDRRSGAGLAPRLHRVAPRGRGDRPARRAALGAIPVGGACARVDA
jgi:hypothetical protein